MDGDTSTSRMFESKCIARAAVPDADADAGGDREWNRSQPPGVTENFFRNVQWYVLSRAY
jgi:hypothetical protein